MLASSPGSASVSSSTSTASTLSNTDNSRQQSHETNNDEDEVEASCDLKGASDHQGDQAAAANGLNGNQRRKQQNPRRQAGELNEDPTLEGELIFRRVLEWRVIRVLVRL